MTDAQPTAESPKPDSLAIAKFREVMRANEDCDAAAKNVRIAADWFGTKVWMLEQLVEAFSRDYPEFTIPNPKELAK